MFSVLSEIISNMKAHTQEEELIAIKLRSLED